MKKRLLLLWSVALLCVTGCAGKKDKSIQLQLFEYQPAFTGAMQSITLYGYEPGKELMVSSIQNAPLLSEQTKAQAALELLFSQSGNFDFVKNENGVYDYRILQSNRCLVLQINNPCPIADEFLRFTMHMSIVNTLGNLENVSTVSVYAGAAELAGSGFVGPLSFYEGNIPSYFQELRLHSAGSQLTTNLYYMDKNGAYVLPETTTFSAQRNDLENCLKDMVRRMTIGPANKPDLAGTLSPELQVLSARRSGEVLTLNLNAPPTIDTAQKPALPYASLFLSIQSLYPYITGVRFQIQGAPVPSVTDLSFDNGRASYAHFAPLLGTYGTLYFARKDRSSLTSVNRALEASQYNNPAVILTELLLGAPSGEDSYAIFPRSMSRYDLNSCVIQGDTAVVDFKATFFDNCKSLDLTAESIMVYGLVNSLTQMENVSKVQFLIDGQRFDTLTGHLYYTQPFLENPGLVLRH